MPAPKKVAAYPPEYFTLFRRAVERPIVIKCATVRDAESLRAHLYACRSAMDLDKNCDPILRALAAKVMLSVQTETLADGVVIVRLIAQPGGDRLPASISALREALDDAKPEAAAEEEGPQL